MTARSAVSIGCAAALSLALGFHAAGALAGQILTKRERLALEAQRSGSSRRAEPAPGLASLYEEIQAAFLGADPSRADALASRYLEKDPDGPLSADVTYLQALSRIQTGRTADARTSLQRILTNPAWSALAEEARVSIADSYWKEGDLDKARAAYQEALRSFPRSEWAAYVRSRLAGPEPAARLSGQPRPEEQAFFTVQVGSFADAGNAARLAERLTGARYDAYLAKDPARKLTRVRVGRLQTRAEAVELAERLRRDSYSADVVR